MSTKSPSSNEPVKRFKKVRKQTEAITAPLRVEDYVVQPADFVSPPKWHLAHTTWFFENMLAVKYIPDYQPFNADFGFLFNSYYEGVGARIHRDFRGFLTRPTVDEVYKYRDYVTSRIVDFLSGKSQIEDRILQVLELGIQHEQQHQELLWYDIKYILGTQPLRPAYGINDPLKTGTSEHKTDFVKIEDGIYPIGYAGTRFCYDNEKARHEVKLPAFEIANTLVTVSEYLEFVKSGGYENYKFWHDEGLRFIRQNRIEMPLYWQMKAGELYIYTLCGLSKANLSSPVNHLSFYEAAAFAKWKDCRLPTEFEWEAACSKIHYGARWEWTQSAYLPYPGYEEFVGEAAEYNGKFMINQMVLRGGSVATPPGHFRESYRNFFHPEMRWQFSGLRLVKKNNF